MRAAAVLALCVGLGLLPAPSGAAARAPFDGFHAGIEAGMQNLIGGSLIAGVDVLEQESRAVGTLYAGWRKQFGGGFVAGIEAGVGLTDGNLRLDDPSQSLRVDYDNRTQWHYGLVAGHTVGAGRRTLAFAYLSEVSRDFDVTIENAFGRFEQRDEQGLLRYGLGAEHALRGPLRLRFTLGSSRADFGDRPKNLEPAARLDTGIGLTWQF